MPSRLTSSPIASSSSRTAACMRGMSGATQGAVPIVLIAGGGMMFVDVWDPQNADDASPKTITATFLLEKTQRNFNKALRDHDALPFKHWPPIKAI